MAAALSGRHGETGFPPIAGEVTRDARVAPTQSAGEKAMIGYVIGGIGGSHA
jgi:hypothetical protein